MQVVKSIHFTFLLQDFRFCSCKHVISIFFKEWWSQQSTNKGNAAHEAMEAASRQRQDAHMSEIARKRRRSTARPSRTLLRKSEALEKHVKTVTVRAESLASTEADFSKTLLDRQQETQKHLNELSAQLCQTRSAL